MTEGGRSASVVAAWLAVVCALLLAANWEADRQERVRLEAFHGELANLAQVSEAIMAARLRAYDHSLLSLRELYLDDPARFGQRIQWMRSGPLADRELLVVVVDDAGRLAFTDTPNATPGLYLGDRAYYRYFAAGGKDRYYIDEPAFGRATRRYSVPLVRPMYDRQNKFKGVVALSVRQDSLADFGPTLHLTGDATVTVVTLRGAIVTRSRDLAQVQGSSIAPPLLAQIAARQEGVVADVQVAAGVRRIVAYRRIADTPLIIYVAASPDEILRVAAEQRRVLLAVTSLASLLALLLLVAHLQRKKISAKFIASQQGYLKESQRIAKMGSWELDLATGSFRWSDGMYPLCGVATGAAAPDLRWFLAQVDQAGRAGLHAALEEAASEGSGYLEYQLRRADGQQLAVAMCCEAVRDKSGKAQTLIGTLRDISERKNAEAQINDLAFFDQLTRLPNRTLFFDRLKQAMAASARSGAYGALLFIDLDNFKSLNDTLGHDVGDLLLKEVAQRLTAAVREGDTVARLGGDEFLVLLPGLSGDAAEAGSGVETVADKILEALGRPYRLKNDAHRSTASIGVALFKGDGATIDELMKQADIAMYKAKDAGRNLTHFFDPTLEAAVKERVALEADLRRALDEKQFLLYYQAQVADEGRLIGAEALLRWQHPLRGMVAPGEFIPLAEESGPILPLGYWVLRTACDQLVAWAERPELARLSVSVNVSPRQFHQTDFVDQVLAVLTITGANPLRLKLELTESLLVENMQDIIAKMSALKEVGVSFSLDDFGTGYSSLSYLKRLPLDQLKIDQSFVRDVLTDANDAAIARTIVALGQSLGMGVIAEGVETEAQRDFLASHGCHVFQGYFFSRPLPLGGFEAFATRR